MAKFEPYEEIKIGNEMAADDPPTSADIAAFWQHQNRPLTDSDRARFHRTGELPGPCDCVGCARVRKAVGAELIKRVTIKPARAAAEKER